LDGEKTNKRKETKESRDRVFWRLFPFLFFINVIVFAALLGNGYEIFENRGWNTSIVLVIRYLDNFILTLIPFIIGLVLLCLYVKSWKEWRRATTLKNKAIEIVMWTVIMLVPACILIYIAFNLGSVFFQAPEGYWKQEWLLK